MTWTWERKITTRVSNKEDGEKDEPGPEKQEKGTASESDGDVMQTSKTDI